MESKVITSALVSQCSIRAVGHESLTTDRITVTCVKVSLNSWYFARSSLCDLSTSVMFAWESLSCSTVQSDKVVESI